MNVIRVLIFLTSKSLMNLKILPDCHEMGKTLRIKTLFQKKRIRYDILGFSMVQ